MHALHAWFIAHYTYLYPCRCAPVSLYASCLASVSNSTRIPGTEVLQSLGVNENVWLDEGVLLIFLAVLLSGVYLALRVLRGLKPPQ